MKAGLEKDKAALLFVIGALSEGCKETLAIRPGHRAGQRVLQPINLTPLRALDRLPLQA